MFLDFRLLRNVKYFRNKSFRLKRPSLKKCLVAFGVCGAAFWYEIHELKERFGNILPHNINIDGRRTVVSEYIQGSGVRDEEDFEDNRRLIIQTIVQSMFPNLQLNHPNPFYFLRILKSQVALLAEKRAALLALAYSSDLNEGVCRELAQSIDLKTAVMLAQVPDVNLKLFLPPPTQQPTNDDIDSLFQKILTQLPDKNDDCGMYFFGRATVTQKELQNKDTKMLKGMRRRQEPWRVSYLYLQSVLRHSESAANVEAFVQLGGLTLLWRVFQTFQQPLVQSHIVQIVSNIAMFPQHHLHLFQSGWIGILAQLVKEEDVSISLPAVKALANMDDSSRQLGLYDTCVFLLHPALKHQRDVDVVFVHGLLGGVFWTWRQHDAAHLVGEAKYTKCWPRDWLPQDVDGLRILAVDYDTYLSHWKPTCPQEVDQRSIEGRSDYLLSSLKRAGLGNKPIVWVAHSMGGLLVKQLLLSAEKSEDSGVRKIVDQSRALVMLSVPHRGSALASLNPTARFILLPSVEVQELQQGSPKLQALHDNFLELLKRHHMAVLSLVETKHTLIPALRTELRIVDRDSADPGVGEIHYVPATHLDICKPFSRDSFVYKRLVKLLRGVKAGSPPRELATNN